MRNGDLELIKDIGLLCRKKIVLYGAGDFGRKAYSVLEEALQVKPYYFCVSCAEEWQKKNNSKTYLGVDVKGVEQLQQDVEIEELLVVISTDVKNVDGILDIINKNEIRLKKYYTWFGLWFSIGLNINDARVMPNYAERFIIRNRIEEQCMKLNYGRRQIDRLYQNPVLIYQPGKVGSKSIEESLEYIGINNVHIHNLKENGIFENDSMYNDIKQTYRMWIETYAKNNDIKIITMVREPIVRSISLYFTYFTTGYIENSPVLAATEEPIVSYDTYSSLNKFIHEHAYYGKYGEEFEWYNKELKEVFGIDIYEYPFDKEKGYSVIKKDNVQVLVMTLEKMNENAHIIGQFVGVDNFEIRNANVASDKIYKYAYNQLLKEIEIDDDVIERYYGTNKYIQHFYTQQQLEVFRKRWGK